MLSANFDSIFLTYESMFTIFRPVFTINAIIKYFDNIGVYLLVTLPEHVQHFMSYLCTSGEILRNISNTLKAFVTCCIKFYRPENFASKNHRRQVQKNPNMKDISFASF